MWVHIISNIIYMTLELFICLIYHDHYLFNDVFGLFQGVTIKMMQLINTEHWFDCSKI